MIKRENETMIEKCFFQPPKETRENYLNKSQNDLLDNLNSNIDEEMYWMIETEKKAMLERYFFLLPVETREDYLRKCLNDLLDNIKSKRTNRLLMTVLLFLLTFGTAKTVNIPILGYLIVIAIGIFILLPPIFKVREVSKFSSAVTKGYLKIHVPDRTLPDYESLDFYKNKLGVFFNTYDEFTRMGGHVLLKRIVNSNISEFYNFKN
jgi:hypothetical protein